MKSSWKTLLAGKRGSPPAGANEKDVLFVYDEPGAWTRYRCEHGAEELRLLGVACDVVQTARADLSAAVDRYETFVLNRVEWRPEVETFVERARAHGRAIVFDTDDLIFEPGLIGHFAAFDGWPEQERRREAEKLARYRETLRACDAAVVTTKPLAGFAERHVGRVEVVFNAVSREMVRLADRARRRQSSSDVVTIAYLSGTRSHNRDFLQAEDAVLWALETYPRTRFLAVGKLDLDESYARWGERVARIPLQSWQALPKLLAGVDINLAPLEPANPFTECKSCAKYLEAALVGVPTIASPRPDFVRAIEDGRNGLLAESLDEWREALRRLIESPRVQSDLGEAARADVRARHTTEAYANALGQALRLRAPTLT
jgi:glycosyltransferase involved in cell wall biosynthesis